MSKPEEKQLSPAQQEHLLSLVTQAEQMQAAINSFALYLRKEHGIDPSDATWQLHAQRGRFVRKNEAAT